MRQIIIDKLKNAIDALGHGAVFIASDFLDIAEYETIRKALNRLSGEGRIQKVQRGIYCCPRFSEPLQEYEAPSPHQTALAIARKFNWNIAPSGETALNILGLSAQVPAKWSYVSDGAYNRFELGNTTIEFHHRNNREITGMSYMTALVIQSIKAMGRGRVDSAAIRRIRTSLTEEARQRLIEEAKPTTVWIYRVIRRICEEN